MLGLFLGIPLGILSSLLAWWILFHGITPRIRFAERLSRLGTDGEASFRLKLINAGKRHIIDCEVVAELRIRGLSPTLPRNTWIIRVPLRNDRFAHWKRGASRLIVFMPYHPDERVALFLSTGGIQGWTLGELLRVREAVHLRIVVFAYDSFSGSRRVFISKDYTVGDVADGKYCAHSLEITPGDLPPGQVDNEEA